MASRFLRHEAYPNTRVFNVHAVVVCGAPARFVTWPRERNLGTWLVPDYFLVEGLFTRVLNVHAVVVCGAPARFVTRPRERNLGWDTRLTYDYPL